MDLKKLTISQATALVRQLEQEGIDCPNCNKKLSAADSRCPNCDYVFSKAPTLAIVAIIAAVVVVIVLVVYIIALF
jgi:tRNA(Ile2) C34 agmatinyltransferase TiaS